MPIPERLAARLADTFTLGLKTLGAHWNVRGPMFAELHRLFGKQYDEIFAATDDIAERLRAHRMFAPASYASFSALSIVRDREAPDLDAMTTIEELLRDHELVSASWRDMVPEAEAANDQATIDLIAKRSAAHDKAAWMLRATLGQT